MVILHEIRVVGNLTDTFTHMQPSYFIHFIEHLTHKKITIPGAPASLHILYTGTSKIVIFVEVAFGGTHPPSNGAVCWGFRESVIIGDFAYNFRKNDLGRPSNFGVVPIQTWLFVLCAR